MNQLWWFLFPSVQILTSASSSTWASRAVSVCTPVWIHLEATAAPAQPATTWPAMDATAKVKQGSHKQTNTFRQGHRPSCQWMIDSQRCKNLQTTQILSLSKMCRKLSEDYCSRQTANICGKVTLNGWGKYQSNSIKFHLYLNCP